MLDPLLRRFRRLWTGAWTGARRIGDQAGTGRKAGTFGSLIRRADAARDAGQFHAAAMLYDEALCLAPGNAGIQVQCGHMFKEAGDLPSAEAHYLAARQLIPDDPDLMLQLGHFYKVAARREEAAAAYHRALALRPGWTEPIRELANLRQNNRGDFSHLAQDVLDLGLSSSLDQLVPELAPRPPDELQRSFVDSIHVSRLGSRPERSRWGTLRFLRGIEAIRGYCISSTPLSELQVALDGRVIHGCALQSFALGTADRMQRKYVFNVWFDFSAFAPGPHEVELRFVGSFPGVRMHRERVVVAAPVPEQLHPGSDTLLDPFGSEGDVPLEDMINARPSVVRPARRTALATPRTVLVMRTDQLGDMVTSIPALRRLREMLPLARIVGLLTAANAEFARTLPLFDEVLVADFPHDEAEQRRIMALPTQDALRQRLQPYNFDLAIDLAESSMSRPLLLLSGARFLYGFGGGHWPWLDAEFQGRTHDPANRLEAAPQSAKVLALIEHLGTLLGNRATIVRRDDLTRDMLAPFGIGTQDRFAVLHTGARIGFSRWPHYDQLAALLLARTELKVLLLTDDPALRQALPPALLGDARFRLLDRPLPFDGFDALLSFCDVFVGNDSGPKHLASLRGAPVVSVHSSRINWNDWGQELTGLIVSRKVPCAGCLIYHDTEECGKDYACIRRITAQEVFDAVMQLLPQPPTAHGIRDSCPTETTQQGMPATF